MTRPASVPSPASQPNADALPPLELLLVVPAPPERAFDYFTQDWGQWWPRASHSVCLADAVAVMLEPGVGGRLLEIGRDGSEHCWGVIEAWDPPQRLRFTWHPGAKPEQAMWVDVSFTPNPKGTLVKLAHGGWAVLQGRASPVRAGYETGWGTVLKQAYRTYCEVREEKA